MQNDKNDPCHPDDLSFYVVGLNVFFGLLLVDVMVVYRCYMEINANATIKPYNPMASK